MYNLIIDPITNKRYNISSTFGKIILKKYIKNLQFIKKIKYISGGSNTTMEMDTIPLLKNMVQTIRYIQRIIFYIQLTDEIHNTHIHKSLNDFINKALFQQSQYSNDSKGLSLYQFLSPANTIFDEEHKKIINEFINSKDEVDDFLNDINSEYKDIKKIFNNLF